MGNYNYFYWVLPIKSKKLIFSSYYGKGYWDNGKYIIEEIIKQELEYDIVWLVKKYLINEINCLAKVRIVEYGTFKSLYELATSKIWIDNCRKMVYPPKRKSQ